MKCPKINFIFFWKKILQQLVLQSKQREPFSHLSPLSGEEMMINTSHVGFFFSIVPFRTFLKKKNAKPKHKKSVYPFQYYV
jgi:hypothetical protein